MSRKQRGTHIAGQDFTRFYCYHKEMEISEQQEPKGILLFSCPFEQHSDHPTVSGPFLNARLHSLCAAQTPSWSHSLKLWGSKVGYVCVGRAGGGARSAEPVPCPFFPWDLYGQSAVALDLHFAHWKDGSAGQGFSLCSSWLYPSTRDGAWRTSHTVGTL